MRHFFALKVILLLLFSHSVMAAVSEIDGGYRIDYAVDISAGTSNGNDIQDVLMLEWNDSGDFSAEFGQSIAGRGRTTLSHVIDFEPTMALVMGWGAAIPGVGDEKDHLFTLINYDFAREMTGKKWSEAFPGVGDVPRTGHNAMIGLLQDAAAGNDAALATIVNWTQREAQVAAFDPHRGFRVMEWTDGHPIDVVMKSVPTGTPFGTLLLVFAILALARVLWRSD